MDPEAARNCRSLRELREAILYRLRELKIEVIPSRLTQIRELRVLRAFFTHPFANDSDPDIQRRFAEDWVERHLYPKATKKRPEPNLWWM